MVGLRSTSGERMKKDSLIMTTYDKMATSLSIECDGTHKHKASV